MGSARGTHVLNGQCARGTPLIKWGVLGGHHVLNGQCARGTPRIKGAVY